MYPCETSFYHALLTGVLILAVFIACFITGILYYHKRKRALHKTAVYAEITALEKERARIAGDLHDDLGVSLSAIKLKLQRLAAVLGDKEKLVADAENYIDESMLKLKRISFNMMPAILERKGLKAALEELTDILQQTTPVAICCKCTVASPGSEKTMHIYRIIQEALNNIIKHSDATAASIELKKVKNKTLLRIADNGRGFNKTAILKNPAGRGLQNIMARADLLDAKIFLTTAEGNGVELTLQIP